MARKAAASLDKPCNRPRMADSGMRRDWRKDRRRAYLEGAGLSERRMVAIVFGVVTIRRTRFAWGER